MSQVRAAFRSGVGRVAMAAMLLLGLLTVTPMLSGAASAHTAHLEASVSCDGTVDWTATSWSKDDKGSNDDVRVHRTSGGSDDEVGHGSFGSDNGYTFSGHFTWPAGATTMTVSTHPQGTWGSGDDANDQEGHDEVELKKPDCDGHPHVEHELKCDDTAPGYGDGDVTIHLTNPAGPFGHDAEFQVYDPDQNTHHTTYTVHAGEQHDLDFHGLGEGHHHIKVTEGHDDDSRDVEVDCDQGVPSVTASKACINGDGAITVNLFNTGGEAVTFSVEDPTTHVVETVKVEPNGSQSRTFAGLADGEYTVHVMAGKADLSQHFTVHCDKPVEPPHPECEADHGDDHGDNGNGHDGSTSTSMETETTTAGSGYSSRTYQSHTSSTSTSVEDHHSSTSTSVKGDDGDDHDGGDHEVDPCNPPPEKPQGKIAVAKACVANDGQVTITLTTVGGDHALLFTVEGVSYSVAPGQSKDVVLSGLTDGTHHISVTAGYQDLSFDVDIACDLSPRITVTQECSAFDGSVSFLLENLGDDASATFTINGVDHVLAPGASQTVVIDGLPDGVNAIPVAINGVAMPDVTVTFDCNPVLDVVAQCNTVTNLGEVQTYWFTITNTEAIAIDVSWDGGSATIPAGATVTIGATTAALSVQQNGEVVATAAAADVVCSRDVTVDKELIGAPAAPETYTVTVSRLVDGQFVPEVSFPIQAGASVTVTLPSTLDPAGIQYRVDETNKGTATDSVVTPDQFTLVGHLGDPVHVTVTNSYTGETTTTSTTSTTVPPGDSTTTTTPGGSTTTSVVVDPPPPTSTLPATTTTINQVEPPVPTTTIPTTTTIHTGPLPHTGGSSPLPTLLIAFGIACIGGSLALVRRRATR
ncbi:MAG: hypothetical protein RJA49_2734 [Actinomycetota bacterium]